jgi:toxin ParE1/3/4
MKVEYSNRVLADLRKLSAGSQATFGHRVAAVLEARIRAIVEQIRQAPESAPRVEQRPGVRVVPLVRYPYKIFYRIPNDTVRILHVRHTSRRPWENER